MTSPLVSIIIPAYNAGKFLTECVESVLNQTYKHLEIIIIDDQSTDNTILIAENFIANGVKVISKKNGGAAAARNYGLKYSKGEYVKFLDADDLINPEMIASQVYLAGNRDDLIISCKWGRFYNNNIKTFKLNPEECWKDLSSLDWIKLSWKYSQPMLQPGIFLIPRRMIEMAGGWNEHLSLIDDFEYFTRTVLTAREVLFSDQAVLYYRSGDSATLSGKKSREAFNSAYVSATLATSQLLEKENSVETRLLCANCLKTLVYEYYFIYPELIPDIEEEIEKLGGSNLKIDGSNFYKLVSKLIGWKQASRIKNRIKSIL